MAYHDSRDLKYNRKYKESHRELLAAKTREYYWTHRTEIREKLKVPKPEKKPCLWCAVVYQPRKNGTKYCSRQCGKLGTRRSEMLNRLYGLSLDGFDEIWIEQLGICPICRKTLPKGYKASVDHCHKKNKIRGLLHQVCNAALGCLRDSPEAAEYAAAYLRGSSHSRTLPE